MTTKKTVEPVEPTKIKGTLPDSDQGFALPKQNYIYIVIGVVIIIFGFLLMTGGGSEDPNVFNEKELFSFRRITLAPIVVFLGFAFEIWAIMRKPQQSA